MKLKTGVLLINLGTPNSPKVKDVYRYLTEFLTDPRVIDEPWLKRQFLVRGVIIPARVLQSARSYKKIWTAEGSPLMVYGNRVKEKLQHALGETHQVELAMRYQEPSIKQAISHLMTNQIHRLIILPLFPQYASATTGSVHQRVMEEVAPYPILPHLTFVNEFASHPAFIKAFSASDFTLSEYDHLLFSFHGLPARPLNAGYSDQCYETAYSIAKELKIPQDKFSITFQSRLGKEPWLQPYTNETITTLAKEGKKKVLVFCPSFVCDCLETIYEIGMEYQQEFKHLGGERLDLVPGLNDHPLWIDALKQLVMDNMD